jgi:hypothetical protein
LFKLGPPLDASTATSGISAEVDGAVITGGSGGVVVGYGCGGKAISERAVGSDCVAVRLCAEHAAAPPHLLDGVGVPAGLASIVALALGVAFADIAGPREAAPCAAAGYGIANSASEHSRNAGGEKRDGNIVVTSGMTLGLAKVDGVVSLGVQRILRVV